MNSADNCRIIEDGRPELVSKPGGRGSRRADSVEKTGSAGASFSRIGSHRLYNAWRGRSGFAEAPENSAKQHRGLPRSEERPGHALFHIFRIAGLLVARGLYGLAVIFGLMFVGGSGISLATETNNDEPSSQPDAKKEKVVLFDTQKTSFACLTIAACGTILICTELARRGKPFYVRPIAGLKAIDEAVGRSTEMGKPMLFVPGIQDVNEIDTVAGLTVLSTVARLAAEYDTPLEVPTARALVMTAAREAIQAAALAAGRPDYYNEDRVYYVTDEQFGYVASVCGWMYREKPAACFYLGKFYAESLILAETGNAVGAIQIAGTAETAQLPFFVAACDYTLLGEELFAASAYLSGEPAQLGMLKGQDFGKLAAMVLIVVGCLLATWDSISPQAKDANGKSPDKRTHWITHTILKGG